jgi:FlaA1/EpsC-like NDP-sugar epimerase
MNQEHQKSMNHKMKSAYARFAAIIATSMLFMYGLTYLNTYDYSHIRWSETRLYMTLIMGAAMTMIMLLGMQRMYTNTKLNAAIVIGSLFVFFFALFLVRSQITVGDSSYMSAMIPHHSIAILTSENAQIKDLRVLTLADEISEAQRREIAEMNWLLRDIAENGIATTEAEANARPVPDFEDEP